MENRKKKTETDVKFVAINLTVIFLIQECRENEPREKSFSSSSISSFLLVLKRL